MAIAIKNISSTKRGLEQEVTHALGKALEGFKDIWGEKKFTTRVKKASKRFLKGMPQKIETTVAKPAKKKAASRAIKKTAEKPKSK